MELADIEAFLVLAEELHFGSTAERTFVSRARVSQRIAALEREVGGLLFERTSRRVRLTPLGAQLQADLVPGYDQIRTALADARRAARSLDGWLRVGFTTTTGGEVLNRAVVAFEEAHPGSHVALREIPIADPVEALRSDTVDVLVNWAVHRAPDLTAGPVLESEPRVLAVSADHPLAGAASVSAEVLAEYPAPNLPGLNPAIRFAIVPPRTPSGRKVLLHPEPMLSLAEVIGLVVRGHAVHPTVPSLRRLAHRDDLVFVPITDLPPLSLGLVWRTATENARIRAFADTCRALGPPAPPTPSAHQ